ncbi:MAG: deoxyribose-phosphate aldolase [Lachnospiraceae bacterium]|uniref:Deoxyribose-phosphate aldolase n=1 Tax=Candidatus Weimeria bifida TaxID=2599074 RepID=A0A6N7J0K1_9FIRM|nr:deoxyribose-phosphate aldolase [Candidatus Weimeria bifida]RRF96782.1 MAG: deoxyribose-phosphate aldolase [Lachnospiraceae bacterium]
MLDHKLFDHTLLKADATQAQMDQIIAEAKKYDFMSVCCNSYYTKYVADALKGTGIHTTTVVGFPLGQMSTKSKAFEAKTAVEDGADEIDMVINVAALKDKKYDVVLDDIKAVRDACAGKILKVIIECCLLTDDEKVKACELSENGGADFVKTSTGFSTGGAKAEDVAIMKKTVGDRLGVKASGGIHSAEEAESMVKAGATRLGTSATLKIIGA